MNAQSSNADILLVHLLWVRWSFAAPSAARARSRKPIAKRTPGSPGIGR